MAKSNMLYGQNSIAFFIGTGGQKDGVAITSASSVVM